MRFSIAKLLVAMLAFNVLIGLIFAVPTWIGYPLLVLLALVVVPPFIIVGVVNTRGPRQAFFLGCMVAGLPHFLTTLYTGTALLMEFSIDSFADDEAWIYKLMHVGGYFLGLIGGLSGWGAWFMIVGNDAKKKGVEKQPAQNELGLDETTFMSEESMEEVLPTLARTPK